MEPLWTAMVAGNFLDVQSSPCMDFLAAAIRAVRQRERERRQ